MFYHITLIGLRPGSHHAIPHLGEWLPKSPFSGKFLACWSCEIGVVNQVLLMHGYDDMAALTADRDKVVRSTEGYGIGDMIASVNSLACTALPGSAPITPGTYGPVFEVRNYQIKPGVLPSMIDAWVKGMPAREKISKPLGVMYSIEGASSPRWIHIWPYPTLEERARARKQAADEGIWPPKGTSSPPAHMISEIFLPTPFSPVK